MYSDITVEKKLKTTLTTMDGILKTFNTVALEHETKSKNKINPLNEVRHNRIVFQYTCQLY